MLIYKITNTINGRVYIGQTIGSLAKRWNEHSTSTKNSPMYNAFRNYGRENFKIEPLCSALSPESLNYLEQYFIDHYKSMSPLGYNLTSGGDSAYIRSDESREKQRIAMLGRIQSDATKAKISESLKGRPGVRRGAVHTEAARKLISLAGVGRKVSEETREKMRAAHTGSLAYNSKKVICIETQVVYSSTSEAARLLNLQQTSISSVCLGKRKSTGGLTFRFK